jgi:hypothetical protein
MVSLRKYVEKNRKITTAGSSLLFLSAQTMLPSDSMEQ